LIVPSLAAFAVAAACCHLLQKSCYCASAQTCYLDFHSSCPWMRITRCDDEHLIALSAKEASTLLDAAVLIAVAVDSVPDVSLPAEMATLIGDIFTGLSKAVSKGESVSSECF